MKVLLGVPFRDPDGSRLAPFAKLLSIVPGYYEFADVIASDSGHHEFNRAASRNLIFQYGEEQSYDVVVACDADSIPTAAGLVTAVECAFEHQVMHHPFNVVYEMVPKAIHRINVHPWEAMKHYAYSKCYSEGGIWVASPETFWKAGGFDQRFDHWGPEDRALRAATRSILGDPHFSEGELYCLYHTADRGWRSGVDLMMRYESSIGKADEIQSIIKERIHESRVDYHRTELWASEVSGPVVRSVPRNLLPS